MNTVGVFQKRKIQEFARTVPLTKGGELCEMCLTPIFVASVYPK